MTLNYYYLDISISDIGINFDPIYNLISDYFEKVKYKQSIPSKFNVLILKSVISKNKCKQVEKCVK